MGGNTQLQQLIPLRTKLVQQFDYNQRIYRDREDGFGYVCVDLPIKTELGILTQRNIYKAVVLTVEQSLDLIHVQMHRAIINMGGRIDA